MKKLLQISILFLFFIRPCFATDTQVYSFFSPEREIKNTLLTQVKYANKSNFSKYLSVFDEDYCNADGLDLAKYSKMVGDVWKSYKNIKYKIEISDISVENTNATVKLKEYSNAKINDGEKFDGKLVSESDSIYYLKKINNKWKIYSDKVLDEKTYMLYGDAQNLDIKLSVPNSITANTEYCATLEFVPPKESIAIASITADVIEYPQPQSKEVFRTLPEDNILERLFTANNKNMNEYIVASIGLTKSEISDISIKLSLTGYGYAVRRVNVLPKEDTNNVKSK